MEKDMVWGSKESWTSCVFPLNGRVNPLVLGESLINYSHMASRRLQCTQLQAWKIREIGSVEDALFVGDNRRRPAYHYLHVRSATIVSSKYLLFLRSPRRFFLSTQCPTLRIGAKLSLFVIVYTRPMQADISRKIAST